MPDTIEKRLGVVTLGCRLNQYESERMASEIAEWGFQRVSETEFADLFLINTCTVTHRADSGSRQAINRVIRNNPGARIVVTGCLVESDRNAISAMAGVHALIGNDEKERIAELLPSRLPELFGEEPAKGCSTAIADFTGQNRAWVKISDGCNQWCSFCIIPKVRGRLRSREPLSLIREIQGLHERGFREVVLTGVNVGHYRYSEGTVPIRNLAALIRFILIQTDIERIRVSSIEPQTVRGDLVDLYAEGDSRMCRHWHMPLQSGSSRVLRAMKRPYDQRTYVERVETIKECRQNTIVGADVIVGFPDETDEDFERTIRLCESGLLDYLHVFSYSNRAGTDSATMEPKTPPSVIKERSARLHEVALKIRHASHKRQVGQILGIIAEQSSDGGRQMGVSDNYIKVQMPPETVFGREIVHLEVLKATESYVTAGLARDGETSL